MKRKVSLPVVLDRRVVLRGVAATLLASLTGCGVEPEIRGGRSETVGSGGTGGSGDTGGSGGNGGSGGTGDEGGTGGTGGTAASPGFVMCGSELCIDLADPANVKLLEIDGARVITLETRRILVVRTDELTFVALSAICTHAGCTVRYEAGSRDIACPCHGSTFELDGSVTQGPAETPLTVFPASYDATTDIVKITL